jgi:sulfate adenylyltransferase
MLRLAEPHAGVLVNRIVDDFETQQLRDRAARLPKLTLSPREIADLELIASGAASPLAGFMGLRDYRSVLDGLRLADGTPWPVPFTLAVTIGELAAALRDRAAALLDDRGRLRAVLEVTDAFVRDPREEARALYGTDDPTRRAVAYLLSRPAGTLGGPVAVLPGPGSGSLAAPREVRATARAERWKGLRALAALDGVGCIEPIGVSRPALLPVPHVPIRQAPGRDAFLHAIVLKNFGAREVLFEYDRADWLAVAPEISPEDLGIVPVWVLANRRGCGRQPHEASPIAVTV